MIAMTNSFDPIWNKIYQEGRRQNYPWDFVVSFLFRQVPDPTVRASTRVLEVGCGSGSNLWAAAREGFQVFGIDASDIAIKAARDRFARDGLSGSFVCADFASLPFDENYFDLVIDRGALTCVGLQSAQLVMKQITRVSKSSAKFLFNPYSDEHSSAASGVVSSDGLTVDITRGTLRNSGQICFYDKNKVLSSLAQSGWHPISMQLLKSEEMMEHAGDIHAEWRVVAERSSASA